MIRNRTAAGVMVRPATPRLALIDRRLHAVVFTIHDGNFRIRVNSCPFAVALLFLRSLPDVLLYVAHEESDGPRAPEQLF
jgi:hypothetical protein